MQDVTIPALGMAMTGAVLTRWYKEPGEAVTAGEVIAEIETDKSAVDLESPADGVLGPHLVAEGVEVPVGTAVTQVLDHEAPAANVRRLRDTGQRKPLHREYGRPGLARLRERGDSPSEQHPKFPRALPQTQAPI